MTRNGKMTGNVSVRLAHSRGLPVLALGLLLVAPAGVLAQAPKANNAPAARPGPAPAAQRAEPPKVTRAAVSGDVVARAGDNDLTKEEVRAFVATLSPAEQSALARDPALFSQTLRVMLANQLVLKEALAKKWHEEPTIAAQLQRARDNVIVETYLQSVSAAPESYPSESELEKTYEANKAAFAVPRTFHVAQIYVALPEGADKEAEDKAKKKLAEVQAKLKQANADFAAVAKAESDEPASAQNGGEIGWLAESQIRPEIKAQVLALSKGGITAPVQVKGGWHIIKLLDTKPAGTRSFSEVKDALAQRVRAQRAEANRRAYLAKLLEQSPPTINELALANVLEQPKSEPAAR